MQIPGGLVGLTFGVRSYKSKVSSQCTDGCPFRSAPGHLGKQRLRMVRSPRRINGPVATLQDMVSNTWIINELNPFNSGS